MFIQQPGLWQRWSERRKQHFGSRIHIELLWRKQQCGQLIIEQ
jgi:hypothetical protein